MQVLGIQLFIGLIVVAVAVIALSIRVVPHSQQWVVERLGQRMRILKPGMNLVLPFADRVRHKVNMVQYLDNIALSLDLTTFMIVYDPIKASYALSDLPKAVDVVIRTTLRSLIGSMPLDDLVNFPHRIEENLRTVINEGIATWGIAITNMKFGNIKRSYPHYKFDQLDPNSKLLTIAVPGFMDGDLAVELEGSRLIVRGNKQAQPIVAGKRPIGSAPGFEQREFERRFQLGDYVEIKGARLAHGLLEIEVARRIPEPISPRKKIGISGTVARAGEQKIIKAA
jgi:HSP20 family molecular chaperone IbpA